MGEREREREREEEKKREREKSGIISKHQGHDGEVR